jgi:hypothetical protein
MTDSKRSGNSSLRCKLRGIKPAVIQSFEKAVEELLTRQRVGIGFAITELSIMVAGKSYPLSSEFLCVGAKSHRKITKNKARSTDGYNTLL